MAVNRRQVLQGASTAAAAGLLAAGSAWMAPAASARPAQALRPPGALAEDRFLAACLRCGLCVRDCPPQNLKLSMGGNGVAIGTPFFTAREIPCEMCEDLPCVKACPSGALDPALTDITQARMGVAVLIDQENCLNFLGLRCDVCYRVCPVIDEAITLEKISNPRSDRHAMLLPTVHATKCTGCGMCEKSCVLDDAAIKVLPERVARSAPAKHYRRGWEDGNRQGKPDFDYPVQRIPEGQHDLSPLRSGADPYPAASAGTPGGAK